MAVSASTGSFESQEDGSVSIVDEAGEEIYPLEASGISETGAAASVTYELIDENLKITSDALAADSSGTLAKGISWGCVLSYLGLAVGTVGFIVATGGTATVFILGSAGYVISIASVADTCY